MVSLQEHVLGLIERHLNYCTLDTLRLLLYVLSRVLSPLADTTETLTPCERRAQLLFQKLCSLSSQPLTPQHLRTLHRVVLHPSAYLRHSVLTVLTQALPISSENSSLTSQSVPLSSSPLLRLLSTLSSDQLAEFLCHVWTLRFDEKETENVSLATALWSGLRQHNYDLPHNYMMCLSPALANEHVSVRELIANALVGAVDYYPDTFEATLMTLQTLYTSHLPKKPEDELTESQRTSSGLRVTFVSTAPSPQRPAKWNFYRCGVAQTLRRLSHLSPTFPHLSTHLAPLLRFIVDDAFHREPDADIYNILVEAGMTIITEHGHIHHPILLPVLGT